MTNEDLQQIAALLAASEQRMEQRMEERLAASEQRIVERLTAATAANLSDLREELVRRMDAIEERFNNFALTLFAIDQRTSGHTRAIDDLLKIHHRDAGTAAGLARTVEQLAARVAALEGKQPGATR